MGNKSVIAVVAAVLAPLAMVVFVLTFMLTGSQSAQACQGPGITVDQASLPKNAVAGYQGEQLKVAALIINTSAKLGVSAHGQQLAVMTAMGESSLVNLDHGDEASGVVNADGAPTCSLGVFQQQWCLAGNPWGTKAEVTNVGHATEAFINALRKVDGWETLAPSDAAHRVQGNSSADAYTKFWAPAGEVMSALSGVKATEQNGTCSGGAPGNLGKADDYPWKNTEHNAENPVTGFAYRNCTDFAWHRMMQQLGITDPVQMNARTLAPGNAITWGTKWREVGWTVSQTPKVGAVIWYQTGEYGHVAIVKAVNADGTVLEEGYNYGIPPTGEYYTRTIKPTEPTAYLYIPTAAQFAPFIGK
jgi:surface antigen